MRGLRRNHFPDNPTSTPTELVDVLISRNGGESIVEPISCRITIQRNFEAINLPPGYKHSPLFVGAHQPQNILSHIPCIGYRIKADCVRSIAAITDDLSKRANPTNATTKKVIIANIISATTSTTPI